jgi:abequosyltransferase
MNSPKLSICIPTYNRNDKLKNNLILLLPQLNEQCELIILDNHSDVPVAESIADLIVDYGNQNISVIRNPFNLGMGANILRCFEVAQSKWLWILGDYHRPLDDAIFKILQDINKEDEFIFINYCSCLPRQFNKSVAIKREQSFISTNENTFYDVIDNFAGLAFLPLGIYNLSKTNNYLRFGYLYIYSLFPHTALLFKSLAIEKNKVLFSNKEIIFCLPKSSEQAWSSTQLYKSFLLIELVENPIARKKLSKILLSYNSGFKSLAINLLIHRFVNKEDIDILLMYRNLSRLRTASETKSLKFIVYIFFLLALCFPLISFQIYCLIYFFKNKSSVYDVKIAKFDNRL